MAQQRIPIKEWSAKFRSKKEVYNFLCYDAKAVIPPFKVCTIYFLKDLISGKKKCKFIIIVNSCLVLKGGDYQHFVVPHYKTLKIEEIMKRARQIPEFMAHMPEEKVASAPTPVDHRRCIQRCRR